MREILLSIYLEGISNGSAIWAGFALLHLQVQLIQSGANISVYPHTPLFLFYRRRLGSVSWVILIVVLFCALLLNILRIKCLVLFSRSEHEVNLYIITMYHFRKTSPESQSATVDPSAPCEKRWLPAQFA